MIGLSILESVCYFCTLLLISCVDYKNRTIPNKLLVLLIIFRVVFLICLFSTSSANAVFHLLSSLTSLLLTLAVTALFLPLLRKKTGAGDFKLLLACGFCFGIDLYLHSLLVALVLLAVSFTIQLIKKQRKNVPFTPFMCAGMLIASILSYM